MQRHGAIRCRTVALVLTVMPPDCMLIARGGRQRKFPNPFSVFGFFRYAGVASCALMASWAYAAFYAMVILVPRTYVTVRRARGCGALVQASTNNGGALVPHPGLG